jgi:hypothetical protein
MSLSRQSKGFIGLAVLLVGAQGIRPEMTNPAANTQASGTPTKAPIDVTPVIERACYDCHSSQTVWPWYSHVAPVSWLIARDVNAGRRHLNFSAWASYAPERAGRKLKQICDEVKEGDMPPEVYLLMHPAARLSPSEREDLCGWAKSHAP